MSTTRDARRRLLALFSIALLSVLSVPATFAADADEPIAYIGHGAFFDRSGKEIKLTQDFVEKAQAYYRQKLAASVPADKATNLTEGEKAVGAIPGASRQSRLVLQNKLLGTVASSSTDPQAGRIRSILNALDYAMQLQIPERVNAGTPPRTFVPEQHVRDLLQKQSLSMQGMQPFVQGVLPFTQGAQPLGGGATVTGGQQYIDECRANGVPIPPPIGKMDPDGKAGWKSLGFIPKDLQFIEKTPAEVRVFTSPAGMCIALPRYVDDTLQTVKLDGVICLGQTTSKVCFWDNQMPVTDAAGVTKSFGFRFAAGDQIPIGVPDLNIDPKGRYQAGGYDLNEGTGGVCTSCHAGENPYIVHPKANLGNGVLMGRLNKPPFNLPTFPALRYDPFVPASWPQNTASEDINRVPGACSGCHTKEDAGRFPQLSTALAEYCGTILKQAIDNTMPPNAPGSLKDNQEIKNFLAMCDQPPNPAAVADLTP